jgi:predicted AlkP superfamily phosphohydrolase/phosphomutase
MKFGHSSTWMDSMPVARESLDQGGRMEEHNKILIIGIDGATWSVLEPLLGDGSLPNLDRLRKSGSWGSLWSTIPPISAPAWSTFMTGKRPGKHGVFHFTDLFGETVPADGKPQIINARTLRSSTLWDILGHHDRKVAVINVPMTYPPRPVNGLMITGLLTPRSASVFTYPPELSEELTDYVIDLNRFIDNKPGQKGAYDLEAGAPSLSLMQEFRDMLEKRAETSLRLMESRPWDAFVVVFTGTDRMGHYLWPYHRPVEATDPPVVQKLCHAIHEYYVRLDEIVGELVDRVGPNVNVLVMSDHGMGPKATRRMHWNNWMLQQGWLVAGAEGARKIRPDSWFGRIGLPRDRLERIVRRIPGLAKERLARSVWRRSFATIDVKESQAYCVPVFHSITGIRINGEGAGKETLRDEIMSRLASVVDPESGEPVVEEIYRGEDYYHGPYANGSPDILVRIKSDYLCDHRLGHYSAIVTDVQLPEGGSHHPEGIFVASGPGVKAHSEPVTGLRIEDVAPTVLYLMDLAIPSDMDGRVLTEIIAPDSLEYRPMKVGEPLGRWPSEESAVYSGEIVSDEDEEEIRERLRGLGYVD